MIDIRKLKELVKLMVENDLSELDLKDEQEQVSLRRPYAEPGTPTPAVAAAAPQPSPAAAPAAAAPAAPAAAPADNLTPIASPMVGTFYASPDPESPAYVKVGDTVTPDTVVCIVEAMKVFSEIKAEVSGTIEQVVASNADAVEYGQPLFMVRPS